jgi:hypothetical protein
LDVTGTLSYRPQDMRLVFYSIGSTFSVSGGTGVNCTHTATEVDSDLWQSPFVSGTGQLNPPISFTLEDSKQAAGTGRNFIRTVKGIVPNTVTLTATQGEPITVDIDYLANNLSTSSGTTSTVTEASTKLSDQRAYHWSDCSLTLYDESGNASGLNTTKSVELTFNQNRTAPHYLNGSRIAAEPFDGNRDKTISVTMDLDGDQADMLYNKFKKGGSIFNLAFDMNGDVTAVGSKHVTFNYSGCRIISMENPSVLEGTTESTIEISAGSINAVAYDYGTGSGLYTPWW